MSYRSLRLDPANAPSLYVGAIQLSDGNYALHTYSGARTAVPITPSNTQNYDPPLIGLRVGDPGASGTLVVVVPDGIDEVAITYVNVVAGEVFSHPIKRVMATGTTTTQMVGYR